MSAQIYNIRDYQSKAALERARQTAIEHLDQSAVEIFNVAFPGVFYDPRTYPNPPKDTA